MIFHLESMKYCSEILNNVYISVSIKRINIQNGTYNQKYRFYSLVYTNLIESSFRRISVFGTRFPNLLSIVTPCQGKQRISEAQSNRGKLRYGFRELFVKKINVKLLD